MQTTVYLLALCVALNVVSVFGQGRPLGRVHKDTARLDTLNGGPISLRTSIDGKDITIYAPEVDPKALSEKPRSAKLNEAINRPDLFFKANIKEGIRKFELFAEDYRKCISASKWPENFECFKKVEVCFGMDDQSLCRWGDDEMIGSCASNTTSLKSCLSKYEKLFNRFNKCFHNNLNYSFMFDITSEAKLRDYYMIDVDYYNNDKSSDSIVCRFTYANNKYHLISLFGYVTMYRPSTMAIPNELYNKDH